MALGGSTSESTRQRWVNAEVSFMLPWFENRFPLYLAPMAGVTDKIFRQICKEHGADVVVTEFVSAEGVFRRNERTLRYLEFSECERPIGVQLFGADPEHLAEAARMIVDWKRPDFIDLNFGCPVNKVVCKNGGSALLRNQPLVAQIARSVVAAIAPLPVSAKIRIGWDQTSINAAAIARTLEDSGVRAIAVHGRTKQQGYSGEADWDVIRNVVNAVSVPVIGNGDLSSVQDVIKRRSESGVAGVMIGRGAMGAPWIFSEVQHYFSTGEVLPPPSLDSRWDLIRRHCVLVVADRGKEDQAMQSMRSRLMAYSRGMPDAKNLRSRLQHVSSLTELDDIIEANLAVHGRDAHGTRVAGEDARATMLA
jgi:tRNA-dihydrouridine synthase B